MICLIDRFGVHDIYTMGDTSFNQRLSLQVQERVTIGTALACVQKAMPRARDSGQAATISPRHELFQWVDSCTCKIIREKLKEDSYTDRIDMYTAVYNQSDKLEFEKMLVSMTAGSGDTSIFITILRIAPNATASGLTNYPPMWICSATSPFTFRKYSRC